MSLFQSTREHLAKQAGQHHDSRQQTIAMGVDLGKVRDKSAVVIAEYQPVRMTEGGEWWLDIGTPDPAKAWITTMADTLYTIRMLRSIPLGTSYPAVARELVAMARKLRRERPAPRIHLVIDQTGVGRAPVDMVRELLGQEPGHRIRLTGVSFTGTDRCDSAPLHRPDVSMGKAYMVIRLQATLQKRLLQLPKDRPGRTLIADLVDELKSFEVHTTKTGHDTYGAFEVGKHDDLVNALGLSILGDAHLPGVAVGPTIYS